MGPFELMDLVGVDVGFEVSKSFWEQSFHEPRWQPHPIQAKMVAAGRHGRKAGRGYYDYEDGPHRPDDPPPPPATQDPAELPDGGVIEAPDVQLISLSGGSLAELSPRPEEVGWFALPPVAEAPLVELTRGPATTDEQAAEAELYFGSRGKHVEWVGDSPGLVLGRIVSQLVNEAAFALGKGIGTAEDIDTAMRLGFNYPRGPLEWGAAIGYAERPRDARRAAPRARRGALPRGAAAAPDGRLGLSADRAGGAGRGIRPRRGAARRRLGVRPGSLPSAPSHDPSEDQRQPDDRPDGDVLVEERRRRRRPRTRARCRRRASSSRARRAPISQ